MCQKVKDGQENSLTKTAYGQSKINDISKHFASSNHDRLNHLNDLKVMNYKKRNCEQSYSWDMIPFRELTLHLQGNNLTARIFSDYELVLQNQMSDY